MEPRQEHTSTNTCAQGLPWGTLPLPYMHRPWCLYPDKLPHAHLQQCSTWQPRYVREPCASIHKDPGPKLGHLFSQHTDKNLPLCDLLAPGIGVMHCNEGSENPQRGQRHTYKGKHSRWSVAKLRLKIGISVNKPTTLVNGLPAL